MFKSRGNVICRVSSPPTTTTTTTTTTIYFLPYDRDKINISNIKTDSQVVRKK